MPHNPLSRQVAPQDNSGSLWLLALAALYGGLWGRGWQLNREGTTEQQDRVAFPGCGLSFAQHAALPVHDLQVLFRRNLQLLAHSAERVLLLQSEDAPRTPGPPHAKVEGKLAVLHPPRSWCHAVTAKEVHATPDMLTQQPASVQPGQGHASLNPHRLAHLTACPLCRERCFSQEHELVHGCL